MGLLGYLILGVVVIVVLATIAATVLGFGAAMLGFGATMLCWVTGIFHAFKPEDPPGPNDDDWSRDQGREAG